MNNIVEIMPQLKTFTKRKSVDEKEIISSEKQLGVVFADEYFSYVKAFGVVSYYGHELTGICASPRLNVVDVTINERENNPNVPKDWYVIEQANIDGIVIWQNSKGEIYQTQPCRDSIKIANSIVEYISSEK